MTLLGGVGSVVMFSLNVVLKSQPHQAVPFLPEPPPFSHLSEHVTSDMTSTAPVLVVI